MLLPSVVEPGPVVPPLVAWSCDGEPTGRLPLGVPSRCLSGLLVVGWGLLGLGLLLLGLPMPAWGGDAGAGHVGTTLGMLLAVLGRVNVLFMAIWRHQHHHWFLW